MSRLSCFFARGILACLGKEFLGLGQQRERIVPTRYLEVVLRIIHELRGLPIQGSSILWCFSVFCRRAAFLRRPLSSERTLAVIRPDCQRDDTVRPMVRALIGPRESPDDLTGDQRARHPTGW